MCDVMYTPTGAFFTPQLTMGVFTLFRRLPLQADLHLVEF